MAGGRASRLLWLVVAVAVALPFAFWWFQNDDAAITFAYARAWNRGAPLGVPALGMPRVEGYSNFGWLLLLALGLRVGLSVVATAKIAAALALGATTYLIGRTIPIDGTLSIGQATRSLQQSVASRIAVWCCVPTVAAVVWAASGLENALRDLLLVGLALALHAHSNASEGTAAWRASLLMAACSIGLLMTRPDSFVPVSIAIAFAFVVALREHRWRGTVASFALIVVAGGLFTWWRVHAFGWPLPNTVYAKSPPGGFASTLPALFEPRSQGWQFLRHYLWVSGLALLLPASVRGARELSRRGHTSTLAVMLSPAVVAIATPDWMADGRFYTPICWLIGWTAAWGIAVPFTSPLVSRRRGVRALSIALPAAVVLGLVVDLRLGVDDWAGRLPYQVTRHDVQVTTDRLVAVARREHLVRPLTYAADAGAFLLDQRSLWLLDSADLNEPILSHLEGDGAAEDEYLFRLQRPELIEVVGWGSLAAEFDTARLRAEGYHLADSTRPDRPVWATASAGATGGDVDALLDRLGDPDTPVCWLARLARAAQNRSAGELPPRAVAVGLTVAERHRGVEGAFAAFVLDPTDPSRQVSLVDELAAHRWSDCPRRSE